MNKTELNEKIYAAALGCLDKKELLVFKETNLASPDYADKNFGVFQQLTSLLPLILSPAEPEKGIKDRIARKVYRLKDNSTDSFIDSPVKIEPITTNTTTEKIIVQPIADKIPEKVPEVKEAAPGEVVKEEIKPTVEISTNKEEKAKPNTQRFEKINTLADDDIKNDIVITQKKLDIVIEDKKTQKKREEKKSVIPEVITTAPDPVFIDEPETKNKFFMILLVLISAVAMVGSAFLYIKFSSENDKYAEQINSLNSQVDLLKDETAAKRNLISLIESDDLRIINMNPLNAGETSLVRILLNGNTKSGFLQTDLSEAGLGELPLNLWSVSDTVKNLLLTFSANDKDKFHAFNLPVSDASAEMLLVLTKPAMSDSAANADSLLYTGSFLY